MAYKVNNDKRMVNNLADMKTVVKKNFYVVGTNGKKSFITTINGVLAHEARFEAKEWAKKNGLTLQVCKAK